jgi:integrase/recombinase XerD
LTVVKHVSVARRFLKFKDLDNVTKDDVRSFLSQYNENSPRTYRYILCGLKVFFRDFLDAGYLVDTFKFPYIPFEFKWIPRREELKKFYKSLKNNKARTLFLIYASSGLRRSEVLSLKKEDVNFKQRMIIPSKRSSRTKVSLVSFYNNETEEVLETYMRNRKRKSDKLFPIHREKFRKIWTEAHKETGLHITPQVLRKWFSSEMAQLGVPDRYVDAFCGRTPKSVLARHYTDYSPRKLKEIYDNASLKVLK